MLIGLLASPALAGPAEDAAVLAATVQEEHCAGLYGADVTLKAGSLKSVAAAWEAVSLAYDQSPELFLLYWRGSLAHCLPGFEGNARADLEAFWTASLDEPSLADPRRDAQRRLRKLGVKVSDRTETGRPALGIGIGLLAGGGVFAGLSGWQVAQLRQAEATYTDGSHTTADVDAARVEGERAATASNALVSGAVGMAIASAPLLLVDALLFAPRARTAAGSTRAGTEEGLTRAGTEAGLTRAGTEAGIKDARVRTLALPTASVSLEGHIVFGVVGRW